MKILEIPPPSVVAMVDAIAAWNLRAATEALERVTAEPEAEAQSCVDADGLPTEGAVLRRQLIAERAAREAAEAKLARVGALREVFERWRYGYGFNDDSDEDVELMARAYPSDAGADAPAPEETGQ